MKRRCEKCDQPATHVRADSLADHYYYCRDHISEGFRAAPPSSTFAAVWAVTFASSRPAINYLLGENE